jgi:hypothetical protein
VSSDRNIGGAIALCVFGVSLFFVGFTRLRKKRRIEDVPTSTVRGMAMGLVELIGEAKKTRPLKSPLTNTDCVYYRYNISEYRSSGKSGRWVTIASGNSKACPFTLDDGTGKIDVFPEGAETLLPVDYEFRTGWGKQLPDNLKDYETRFKLSRRWLGRGTLRFQEWYVKEGEKVYVLGTAKKSRDFVDDRKQKLAKRIEELKDNEEKMKAVDLDKDGQISQEEWDLAVSNIERQLLEEEIKSGQLQEGADVMIGKGEVEKMFIISDHSQKDLINKLKWQAFGGIIGGAVLSLLGLAYVLWCISPFFNK